MTERYRKAELQALVDAFKKGGSEGETDQDLGEALLDLVQALNRTEHRISDDDPKRKAFDEDTLRRLFDPKELGPKYSVAEGVYRRLKDDPVGALAYLSRYIEARSSSQSARAKKERRRDIFSQLIEDIVEEQPNIAAKEVERMLCARDDVQEDRGELRYLNDPATMLLSNLPSRVTDAKKRLKKG